MSTNHAISPNDTVADIVVRYPRLSRVFESMRIDYCCGGNVPLESAASQKGIDVTALVGLLTSAMPADAADARPAELDTPALIEHLEREEHELFPVILSADSAAAAPVDEALHRDLVEDHQEAGDALDRLRDLTDGYTLPDWGCNTYRALLDGLAELERDTHQHVHLENNVLFRRLSRG